MNVGLRSLARRSRPRLRAAKLRASIRAFPPRRPETGVRMSDLGVMEGCGADRRARAPKPQELLHLSLLQVRRIQTVPDWSQQRLDPTTIATDSCFLPTPPGAGPLLFRHACDCPALSPATTATTRRDVPRALHGLQVSFRTPWPVTSEPRPNPRCEPGELPSQCLTCPVTDGGKCWRLVRWGLAEDRTSSSKGLEVRSKSNWDAF